MCSYEVLHEWTGAGGCMIWSLGHLCNINGIGRCLSSVVL